MNFFQNMYKRWVVNAMKSVGFKNIKISGTGHVLYGFGKLVDSRHSRFITITAQK